MPKAAKALYRCLLTGGYITEQRTDSVVIYRSLVPFKILLPLGLNEVHLFWPSRPELHDEPVR